MNGVAVLQAVQAVHRRAARVQIVGRGAVELGLQPVRNRVVGAFVGARPPDRGHHPGAELQRHHLPVRGVRGDVGRIDSLQ
ncbi:MAG: hypothetical protein J4G16_14275 [Acidobacteria bacterium]|nr:hypothetical protein [Acidobacteriota bacterium]